MGFRMRCSSSKPNAHFLVMNADQVSTLILKALHSVRLEDLMGPPPTAKTLDSLSCEASMKLVFCKFKALLVMLPPPSCLGEDLY